MANRDPKPASALYWAAVINGVVAVPVMAVMMLMAQRKSIMGLFTNPTSLRLFGWIATAVMGRRWLRCSGACWRSPSVL